MTSKEMRQQAAQWISEARQIQDAAEKEDKRSLTSEETANFDKYLSDALDLKTKADEQDAAEDRSRKLVDLEKWRDEPGPKADPEHPSSNPETRQADETERRYERAFESFLKYKRTEVPAEERALQSDLDVSGGYTVAPPQFVTRLIKFVDDLTFFPSLATIIPVTSSDKIEGVSLDTDPADPAWTAEIGALSEDSSMAFGGRALEPNQLTKLLKVSEKMLMVSALPIERLVRERLAYKLAVTAENVYLNGTGAGQPLGVFVADAKGITTTQDIATGNSTTAFTFDGLKNLKYDLKAQYWPRCNWIFHRDSVLLAAKLKDGDGQYQWVSSVVGGEPDRLLGFPVRISEYAPNTFTAGLYVGILGDFSLYWIAMMQQVMVKRLDELYAANSQIGFVIKSWFDGMPVLAEAFRRVTLAP